MEKVVAPTASAHTAELEELINCKERELEALYRVSEAVVSTIDLQKLLEVTLEQAMAAVGAGVGSILLADEKTGRLSISASRGVPQQYVKTTSVAPGEGIAGWVTQHSEPVMVNDPRLDPRFQSIAVRSDISSAMSVPLRTRTKTVGVLNVSTVAPHKLFCQDDLDLMVALANQMASAIDNARLYDGLQQRSLQLSTMLGVARTIASTLELSEVQQLLSDQLCNISKVEGCALLMYEANSGRFRLGHGHGLKKHRKKHAYLDFAQPVAHLAVKRRKLVSIMDAATHPELKHSEIVASEGITSIAALPLKVKNEVVAVACLFSLSPRLFSESECDLLNALSELAGIAVENARVYQHQYKIAHMLQKHLTPTTLGSRSSENMSLEVGHKYVPAHDVGGDYYDLITISPSKVGLVISDVAGSSVAAAVYTSMAKYVLRAYARDDAPPAEMLQKINRIVYEDTEPELFISMFYGVFDLDNSTLSLATAGHEPGLLYRPGTKEFIQLRAPGILLGILPESDYDEAKIIVESGDVIAVYTDGLTDTSFQGRSFGLDSVKSVIASSALQPAQAIADNLYEQLSQFSDNKVVDDVGIVIVRVH